MSSEAPREPGNAYPPCDFRRRMAARAIDLLVALAPLVLVPRGHPRAGEILAGALLLCGDSLFGPGRSLGKRLTGLRVLKLATRRPSGTRESMARNAIFTVCLVPAVFGVPLPISLGALAVALALEAGVALRPLTRDLGQRRLGDLVAGTQVIDASIAIGLTAPRPAETPRAAAPLASRAAYAPPPERDSACASP
jgi:uncharacterized RDD family membrane protein YckC